MFSGTGVHIILFHICVMYWLFLSTKLFVHYNCCIKYIAWNGNSNVLTLMKSIAIESYCIFSRDFFPLGAVNLLGGANVQCRCFLVKIYAKTKVLGAVGGVGACAGVPPVNPPLSCICCICSNKKHFAKQEFLPFEREQWLYNHWIEANVSLIVFLHRM